MYNIIYYEYYNEVVDTAENLTEANYLCNEYKYAYNTSKIKIQKQL